MEIYVGGMLMPQLYQTTRFHLLAPSKKKKEKISQLIVLHILAELVMLSSSLLITWSLLSLYAIFLGCSFLEFLTLFMCSLVPHSC